MRINEYDEVGTMRIGESTGTSSSSMMAAKPAKALGSGATDAQMNQVQAQIDQLNKSLSQINQNQKLTAQQKMDKKKEIQTQIADLTKQLQELQIEKQKETQEAKRKAEKAADEIQQQQQQNSDAVVMDPISMEGLIKAGAMQHSLEDTGEVKDELEGEIRVKKQELKTDAGRGDVSKKQDEINDLSDRVNNINKTRADQLGSVNKSLTEQRMQDRKAKEQQTDDQAEKNKTKTDDNQDPYATDRNSAVAGRDSVITGENTASSDNGTQKAENVTQHTVTLGETEKLVSAHGQKDVENNKDTEDAQEQNSASGRQKNGEYVDVYL